MQQAQVQPGPQVSGEPAPPQPEGNPWRPFFQEQRRQRAAGDRKTSVVLLIILFIVAVRTHHLASPWELLQHSLLAGLVLFSALEHSSPVYLHWRNIIVVAMRLGTAGSVMVAKHAGRTLQARPPQSPAAIIPALMNILVADHSLLLVFLATGYPVGSLSNLLIQLISVLLVMRHNREICDTEYMRQVTRLTGIKPLASIPIPGFRGLAQSLTRKLTGGRQLVEACVVYTSIMQVLVGFIPPAYFFVCHDTRSALRHAEQHGIAQDDRLHRMYRTMHSTACLYGTVVHRLGLLLAAISAMWVVGCMAYSR